MKSLAALTAMLLIAPAIRAHVPPAPPSQPLGSMTNAQMIEMMAMDDAARFGVLRIDRLEWQSDADALAWDVEGRYGGDYHKAVLKTQGTRAHGSTEHADVTLLWDRALAAWWSLQAGARHDFGEGPQRTWVAVGVEGLAPLRLDVEATLYLGEESRTALRTDVVYDLRLTRRLLLQPRLELNLYGKDDPERGLGSGLSDIEAGLRLRYEVTRSIAPYVGLEWHGLFGATADLARARAEEDAVWQFVAGLRARF